MTKLNTKLSFIAAALALSFQAQADVRINGFANFTVGKTTEDTTLFGQDKDIDFSNASMFALQVSGNITDNVMATAQIVAKGEDNYSADFEWAYLTYNMSDNSTLSAGRFRLPVFRYSASLDVGYSYHWISAPAAVYDVVFNNINGVRYDYSNYVDDFEYVVQVSFGNYEDEIGDGSNEGTNVFLSSFEGTYNSFKGRVVYGQGDNLFSSPTLDNATNNFVNQIGQAVGGEQNIPQSIFSLVDDIRVDDDSGTFIGVGLEFDNFDYFVAGEWTKIEIEDSFSPSDTAYYVTMGARIGKWTPHFTYQARDGRDDFKFQDEVANLPQPFQAGATQFNNGLQSTFFEDYTISTIGVRYDVATNVALKGEISKYDNKIEPLTNPNSSIDTNLLNLSVQYVF